MAPSKILVKREWCEFVLKPPALVRSRSHERKVCVGQQFPPGWGRGDGESRGRRDTAEPRGGGERRRP